MFERVYLQVRHWVYKNRFKLKKGSELQLPASAARLLKKTTIKLAGRNNRLVIGEGAQINHCEIRLDGENNLIEVGANVRFSSGKIYLRDTSGQHIRIGADTTVEGAYLLVDEAASIDIGCDCMLSTGILIRVGDKHSILDAQTGERINQALDVRIADRVWIGRDVQILKGTVVHQESVVGTRAVLNSAFTEGNCVVAGMPGRIVRRGIRWDRDLL